MEILNGFVKYETPRRGIFHVETGEYDSHKGGWVQEPKEYLIIGETAENYIDRLLETGHREWVDDEVIELKYILPIGPHKSRLVTWLDTQLSIF